MTPAELIAFEKKVAALYDAGKIKGPIHLSGGNEEALIELFQTHVAPMDWVFSTWRSHYHALLHKVPADDLLGQILGPHSMNLCFPEQRFYTSAIAGGILPIAAGVAASIKGHGPHVHCFIGDMTAEMGICAEVSKYAEAKGLPLSIYIEDNGFATDTPTKTVWSCRTAAEPFRYYYTRTWPHKGTKP